LHTPAPNEPTDLAHEAEATPAVEASEAPPPARPRLDPTRYGDWELNGKCVDF
jgi:hypothetical protein